MRHFPRMEKIGRSAEYVLRCHVIVHQIWSIFNGWYIVADGFSKIDVVNGRPKMVKFTITDFYKVKNDLLVVKNNIQSLRWGYYSGSGGTGSRCHGSWSGTAGGSAPGGRASSAGGTFSSVQFSRVECTVEKFFIEHRKMQDKSYVWPKAKYFAKFLRAQKARP